VAAIIIFFMGIPSLSVRMMLHRPDTGSDIFNYTIRVFFCQCEGTDIIMPDGGAYPIKR